MTIAQKFFKSFMRKSLSRRIVIFNCSALVILFMVVSVYLWQVNTGVNQCLKIEIMKEKVEALKKENQELMKQTSNLGSMANVYETIQGLKMVKLEGADYVFFSSQESLAVK
jgi:cell division protein FtsL